MEQVGTRCSPRKKGLRPSAQKELCSFSRQRILKTSRVFQNSLYVFGNTLAGLSAGCLVAQKVLEVLERDNYLAQVQEKGAYALDRLSYLKSLPNVRDVRGKGLMITVDSHNSHLAERVQLEMRKRKVHLIPEGRMIMSMPPFTITRDEIDYFAENLEAVLTEEVV